MHNITLDDVLAGTERRPIKTKRVLTTAEEFDSLYNKIRAYEADQAMKFTPAERAARDEQIWNWLPPINAQGVSDYQSLFGANAIPEYGDWELVDQGAFKEFDPRMGFALRRGPEHGQTLLVNKKANLVYTMADLRAGKPLPGTTLPGGRTRVDIPTAKFAEGAIFLKVE
ncbi:MAG: hypothetical protein K8U03_16910 [Planctomycetia bacterium]|nr:hypothetical protein [Planctomycetia bacterium]